MVYASNITMITSNTTLDYGFDTYLIDASGGNITATLPSITADGIFYILRRIDTSTNTVIVTGTGGQTIDGSTSDTLTQDTTTTIHSFSNAWFSVSGTLLLGQGINGEAQISLHENTAGYSILTTGIFTVQGKFLYRGSNYYGGPPVSWITIAGLNTGTTSSAYEVRLVDVTPGAGSAVLSTISATATTNNTTYLTATSTTFANVPTGMSVIELQARLTNGANPDVRIFTAYFQFI